MDVREKLIEICFREFCDIAGDSPCGCDGCPYGEYDPDNGGCFDEYKKDKIEKLENDMDKYKKEDNGVTVQEWISVDERLPPYNRDVLVYRPNMAMKILVDNYAGYYGDDDDEWYEGWSFYGNDTHGNPVITHWAYLPNPPKGE